VRSGRGLLLASTSLVALLVGGGAPPAFAQCATSYTNANTTGCQVPVNTTITGININHSTLNGSIGNRGTISPNGIILSNGSRVGDSTYGFYNNETFGGGITLSGGSTFVGSVVDFNTFSGGITLSDSGSKIVGSTGSAALAITDVTFSGGVSNSGIIVSQGHAAGILVDSTVGFSGNIVNAATGQIIAAATGIFVDHVPTFQGNISNAGTISFRNYGIAVGNVDIIGGITNSGTLTGAAGYTGISVYAVRTFSGSIVNSTGALISLGVSGEGIGVATVTSFLGAITNAGTISAGSDAFFAAGIVVRSAVVFGSNVAGGGIVNSGSISAGAAGIAVGGFFGTVSTFLGGITNSGTITGAQYGVLVGMNVRSGGSFNLGTFSGGITNTGQISGANGILVGSRNTTGTFTRTVTALTSFSGGIVNSGSGTITASVGNGIWVGGNANTNSSVTITNFANGITNAGMITAGGRGIFVGGTTTGAGASLTISNFSGGITNTGMIGARTGILVNNVLTFSGAISNAGTISGQNGIVIGSGVTFAPGNHIINSGNITGTTAAIDVSAATSAVTIDQTAGTITGAIRLSANADVLNISGGALQNIVGAGSSDTINFNPGFFKNVGSFSGINQVNINGDIQLAGNDSATALAVNNGGTLAGTATLTTTMTVNAGGTLAPGIIGGNTGATLRVIGTVTFNSGATYLETIKSNAPTPANKTVITGTATLGGAHVGIASGSILGAGTRYTILTDTGGGLGGGNTFNPTVTYNGYVGTLSYDADDVFLTFAVAPTPPPPTYLTPLLPAGAPQNVVNVAGAIDGFISGGGTLPAAFQNLFNLSGPQLVNVLTVLDGEMAADAQKGAFTAMTSFLELVLDTYGDGRGGGGGGGVPFAPEQQADLPPDVALAYASVFKAPRPATFDQRWSLWGAAFGGTSHANGDAAIGSSSVTARDYGFAAGADYRLAPNALMGFALAGAGTNWGLAQGIGSGRSDAFMAAAYGRTQWGPLYLSGAAAFADHWFTTNRTALGDQLRATFTGESVGLRLEGGYRYAVPLNASLIGVTPYAALQSQWFHTPTYSEADLTGGGFGLTYTAHTANDTRGELGIRVDDLTTFGALPLILRGRLAWAHDWTGSGALNAAFQALPGAAFTVNGAAVPANSALASASAELRFAPTWSFAVKLDGELASSAQTYAATGTLRHEW
jgi:uncharacterized protein with beta-barrel porin domain